MTLKYRFVFLLLPVFYIIFSFQIIHSASGYYMTGHDPVYPYLMNSLNLANGTMELGIIEHPGTPLEYLGAIVIRVKHCFSAGNLSLTEDVITHSESYLFACSCTLIALLSFVCFLTADFVYRKTSSVLMALFLQLVPVIGTDIMQHALLLKPEAFIIIINTFLAAYLAVTVLTTEKDRDLKIYPVLVSGILMGIVIASKIICAPFVLIIYLLLRKAKNKIIFIAVLILSFILCIIPLIPKYHLIYTWLMNLWSHDGQYGLGQARVLDPSLFYTNLCKIVIANPPFTVACLLLTITFILVIREVILKKGLFDLSARFITGTWISFALLTFLVAKHFSFHYMICAETFVPAALIICMYKLAPYIPGSLRRKQNIAYLLGGVFVLFLFGRLFINLSSFRESFSSMKKTKEILSSQPPMPVVTISEDHSSFIQPSLWFGIIYSGNLRSNYFFVAKEYYPEWYYYLPQTKKMFHWDEECFIPDLLQRNSRFLIYFIDRDSAQEKAVLDDFCPAADSTGPCSYHKIYSNPVMTEDLFIVDVNKAKLPRKIAPRITITSNLETRSGETFTSSDSSLRFQKVNLISYAEHHSGNTSIHMDKNNPYGLDLSFEVQPGDYVQAQVWRKSPEQNGSIVLTGKDPAHFYSDGDPISQHNPDGWDLIKYRIQVPDNYPEKNLNFFLFFTGKSDVYFDDPEIIITPGK